MKNAMILLSFLLIISQSGCKKIYEENNYFLSPQENKSFYFPVGVCTYRIYQIDYVDQYGIRSALYTDSLYYDSDTLINGSIYANPKVITIAGNQIPAPFIYTFNSPFKIENNLISFSSNYFLNLNDPDFKLSVNMNGGNYETEINQSGYLISGDFEFNSSITLNTVWESYDATQKIFYLDYLSDSIGLVKSTGRMIGDNNGYYEKYLIRYSN